jgi:hypothetical protein
MAGYFLAGNFLTIDVMPNQCLLSGSKKAAGQPQSGRFLSQKGMEIKISFSVRCLSLVFSSPGFLPVKN